jgi:hypothetical protein
VSRVSNIEIGTLPSQWHAQLGASVLLAWRSAASPLGTVVSGAAHGTGRNAVAMRDVRRRFPAPAFALAAAPGTEQLGEPTNNQTQYIEKQYVTTVGAVGVDTSGPPRKWEPA